MLRHLRRSRMTKVEVDAEDLATILLTFDFPVGDELLKALGRTRGALVEVTGKDLPDYRKERI